MPKIPQISACVQPLLPSKKIGKSSFPIFFEGRSGCTQARNSNEKVRFGFFRPKSWSGITSGGGPLISVGIFRPKFAFPFLTNRFPALIRELRKGIKSEKSHPYWFARFDRKMSFHFPRVFRVISDRSVTDNGKHTNLCLCFNTMVAAKGSFR